MEAGEVILLAVQPIRHNGRDYAPGAAFSARPDEAAALLESGAVDVPEALPAAVDVPEVPKTQKRGTKATKPEGVAVGIADPEKIAHEAGATSGNGGSE